MRIGVPKEIKNHEYRVGLLPSGVRELTRRNHKVVIETQAGAGVGFSDEDYMNAGAIIAGSAQEIYQFADLVVKVKEPQPNECLMLKPGQLLFTYLHLAADAHQAELLKASGCTAIGYETLMDADGHLPLLTPMSEIAGRFAVQSGAYFLQKATGGSGVLLSGAPGVLPGHVVILGGGVVGESVLRVALGLGARVTVLDRNINRLRQLEEIYGNCLHTLYSTTDAIEMELLDADLVVGAVLIPGGAAPKLVNREMLSLMKHGSVLVDVAIDQGGCFATSRPTTHADPIYQVDGIIHYCVANIPSAVARTATQALTNATLPYVLQLAEQGEEALSTPAFSGGLNVKAGQIVHPAVVAALAQ